MTLALTVLCLELKMVKVKSAVLLRKCRGMLMSLQKALSLQVSMSPTLRHNDYSATPTYVQLLSQQSIDAL